jgi:hypothetical protein
MGRCKAETKRGRQCGNNAISGSDYCHIKAHRSIKEEPHRLVSRAIWKAIRSHWIASISLLGSIVTIFAFLLYLQDKKVESTSGLLTSPSLTSFRYLTVGTVRFIVDSPDNVFLREGDTPILSLRLVNNRLLVSTMIRDMNGDLIAELVDNEWKLNKDSIFDRNYTDECLEVRDKQGRITLQVIHFGDTIHLAGIFRCRNTCTTVLEPSENGAVFDITLPGKEPNYQIPAICDYPSDRHFGACPRIEYKEPCQPQFRFSRCKIIRHLLRFTLCTGQKLSNLSKSNLLEAIREIA